MPWKSLNNASGVMEPGDRNRVITLQQRPALDTPPPSGFPVEDDWTTLVASMPAAKIDLGGREQFRPSQTSAAFDTQWQINYRLDMDPDLLDVPKLRRVVFNGRVHDIVEAKHIGLREGIELFTLAASGV